MLPCARRRSQPKHEDAFGMREYTLMAPSSGVLQQEQSSAGMAAQSLRKVFTA